MVISRPQNSIEIHQILVDLFFDPVKVLIKPTFIENQSKTLLENRYLALSKSIPNLKEPIASHLNKAENTTLAATSKFLIVS